MTARVHGVIAARSVSGVMSSVSSLTSAKRGARAHHSGRRGDERVRWDDDLIARPDPECGQGELQRVGPVGDTDGVIGATVGGPLPLEGLDGRAAYVIPVKQAG